MPIEYSLDEKLSAFVTEVIQDVTYTEFEPLRVNETAFLVAFVRKTNAEGDAEATSGAPVVIRRISAADAVFLEGFHYKLYVDMTRYDEANQKQQRAMIHRALMRVNVEIKESGVKYSTRRPDVETYQANVIRFGAWEEPLLLLRENLISAQKKAAEISEGKPANRK